MNIGMTRSCSSTAMTSMRIRFTIISSITLKAIAVGDEEMIKIHYHTNQPWKVLEYCASLGEIYDIVVEDMDRQSRGLKG